MLAIKNLTFSDIFPIWTNNLWGYKAEPSSCMVYGNRDQYDMNIFNNPVTYFGVFDGDTLMGVNSGFQTDENFYRSRGLWVFPEYRGRGIGNLLLSEVLKQAKKKKIHNVWSYPRKSALRSYLNVGFNQTSDWIYEKDGDRYNCYVLFKHK